MNEKENKNVVERLIVFGSNEENTDNSEKFSSIDLLYDDEDIAIAQIDLMHQDDNKEDHNRNWCNISHEAIVNSLETFRNKPVLYRLNENLDDVTEHAYNNKELRETHIGGIIPEDTKFEFVKNEDNGKTYIRCDVILYKNYCPDLIKILKNNDGNLEISTELKAYGYQDEDSGIFYIDHFILQGSMILSKKVMAGIEGSNIQVLKFSSMETSNMNMRYLQFSKNREELNIGGINVDKKENWGKGGKEILNSLSVEELKDLLWNALDKYRYTCTDNYGDSYSSWKYYAYRLYAEDSYVILVDNEDKDRPLYKVYYSIDKNKVLNLDLENKTKVVEEIDYKEVNNCFVLSKNLYGTSDEIIIENSKEKVIENDFNDLQNVLNCNKILNAKNYKDLVNSAFLLVENDFEDNPLERLKYPVMDFSNNSLVYNVKALEFSLAKATEDNNVEVIEKINDIKESLEFSGKENENVKDEDLKSENVSNSTDETKENWQEKYNTLNEEYTNFKNSCVEKETELTNKITELENSLKERDEKLSKYEKEEKFSQMKEYAEKYNSCISAESNTLIAQKIQNSQECYEMDFIEFKNFVDGIVLEDVLKNRVSKEVKNSANETNTENNDKKFEETIQRRYSMNSFLEKGNSTNEPANSEELKDKYGSK